MERGTTQQVASSRRRGFIWLKPQAELREWEAIIIIIIRDDHLDDEVQMIFHAGREPFIQSSPPWQMMSLMAGCGFGCGVKRQSNWQILVKFAKCKYIHTNWSPSKELLLRFDSTPCYCICEMIAASLWHLHDLSLSNSSQNSLSLPLTHPNKQNQAPVHRWWWWWEVPRVKIDSHRLCTKWANHNIILNERRGLHKSNTQAAKLLTNHHHHQHDDSRSLALLGCEHDWYWWWWEVGLLIIISLLRDSSCLTFPLFASSSSLGFKTASNFLIGIIIIMMRIDAR